MEGLGGTGGAVPLGQDRATRHGRLHRRNSIYHFRCGRHRFHPVFVTRGSTGWDLVVVGGVGAKLTPPLY